ncbi:hypothetical protein PACILC2_22510 [Paenibacillus cisolokensis]|uniref:Uncharacterized protein n=1 Tax=Paenibacillus cisolokensis TaxID=1658519 RepID=A0ABQ4N638_9BACL|nr:hypothetical protein [Paenibacillus cisolokensis]GIQ63683.1 hypothetical protein PACILC2_22510 [Paenibacillus cisolokensis]
MERLYAVIEIATGKLALGKTYYTERDAKLAIKQRIWKAKWPEYAVATFTITPTIVATVDKDGKWTGVAAE